MYVPLTHSNQSPHSEKVRHGKLFVLLYNMSYSQLNANSFVNFSPYRFNLYLLGKAGTAWYLSRNQNFYEILEQQIQT